MLKKVVKGLFLIIIILAVIFMLGKKKHSEIEISVLNDGDMFLENFENLEYWVTYDYEKSTNKRFITDISLVDDGYGDDSAVLISGDNLNDVRIYRKINVTPNSYYKLSVMVKAITDVEGSGATIASMQSTDEYYVRSTMGNWKKCEIYLQTLENQKEIDFSLGLGGYSKASKGYVYYDKFMLEKIKEVPEDVNIMQFNEEYDLESKEDKIITEIEVKWRYLLIISLLTIITTIIFIKVRR